MFGMGTSVYVNNGLEGVRNVSGWYLNMNLDPGVNNILKYARHSRLTNTKFGGNNTNGVVIGGQRKDIFLLIRGDGVYDKL